MFRFIHVCFTKSSLLPVCESSATNQRYRDRYFSETLGGKDVEVLKRAHLVFSTGAS